MTDLDPRWRDALRRHADTAEPTPDAWAAITDRAEHGAVDPDAGAPRTAPGRRPALLLAAAAVVVVLGLAAVVATRGGGEDHGVLAGPPPEEVLPTPETPVRVEGVATVLESPEHGPEACFGAVQESLPPQCTGLPLVGWDWTTVEGEEGGNGTTWGHYRVVGDYDGERLVVTEPATPSDGTAPEVNAPPDPDFSTRCPEPAGGWTVRDPGRLTHEDAEAVEAAAQAEPDYGIHWFDRTFPIGGQGNDGGVLNITFTGDLERHRAELEPLWGGPICITETEVSWADRQRASHEVLPPDGSTPPLVVDGFRLRILSVSSGNALDELQIRVEFAPEAAQAVLTERLGVPVRLIPALVPTG